MDGKTRMSLISDYITEMRPQDILMPVAAGLCCKPGGFHIDPVRPVERAVITHGHSDHARPGHGAVLATQETLDMMRLRYGDNFRGRTQAIAYGEELRLGDIKIKFHPAGHVLGSAQIAVSCKDTCVVASGDYKDAPDPTCAPIYLHGAMEKITRYYQSRGVALGDLRPVKGIKKADLAGTITLAPPSATSDIWTRGFPNPAPRLQSA